MFKPLMASLSALLLAGCSVFGVRSSYEQPEYTVLDTLGPEAEVREYAPRLAAIATVEAADPESGRNDAFRLLFDYISGENQAAQSVSMTTPVATDSGQKIDMTAPVQTDEGGGTVRMTFFFPSGYTMETAPEPLDPRVEIAMLPAETMAVLTFSGSRSEEAVRQRQAELAAMLDGSPWQPAGDPSAMFYDPPWTLWFARRNEVAIPVTRP